MFACQDIKESPEYLKMIAERDSLQEIASSDDKKIHTYLNDFNDIQANLNRIKEMENIITVKTINPNEIDDSAKNQINEDVNLIYDLLQQNKQTIDELKRKLKKSDKRMRELEKMIENMQTQLDLKEQEITLLKEELSKLNIHIEILTVKVDSLSNENVVKDQEIANKTEEINTVWYVYGTKKELTEKQILTKEGGFIGLGKSTKLQQDFNNDYFTKADLRDLTQITLSAKKATIITSHPSSSYKLIGNKTVDKIEITDTKKFWNTSKYLVIVVE